MKKTSIQRAAIVLSLLVLLSLCVPVPFSMTTKSFAAPIAVSVMPTIIITIITEPTSTPLPRPSPTPSPTATPRPEPTATPRPKPTATPLPTATPIPTTVPSPTMGVTPTITVKPTVVVTQKAGPITKPKAHSTPTAVATWPTATPVASTSQKIVSPERNPVHNDLPIMPLVIGALLALCLGAAGFVGIRRVRTALLPTVVMKKQKNAPLAHSWQPVRTVQPAVLPPSIQETQPFSQNGGGSPLQEALPPFTTTSEIEHTNNGPQTGKHRRLGPVRLRKMMQTEAVMPELPEEQQVLPVDFEDMSFLNDPLLQDTLHHYRQKGQK